MRSLASVPMARLVPGPTSAWGCLNQSDEEEEEDEPERYTNNEISMEDEEKSTLVDDTSSQKDDGETSLQEDDKSDKLKQRFIVETITMTTVTEQRIVSEVNDDETSSKGAEESKKGGILKGGKFWKNSIDKNTEKTVNYNDSLPGSKRSEEVNEANDGSTSALVEQSPSGTCSEPNQKEVSDSNTSENDAEPNAHDMASPQSTELTLTFKLGQHLLVANSLKPNSAMRQLFPSPRFVSPPPIEDVDGSESNKAIPPKQFLVTAESLKLFEEAKKSKMLGNINSKDSNQSFIAVMPPMSTGDDDLQNSGLLRTIERNTLRRSLVKYSYEYRNKRLSEKKKNENSLEERIRQLTCGIDDEEPQEEKKDEPKTEPEPSRSSPQGEESKEMEYLPHPGVQKTQEPALVPSNSSSGTGNSAYKKLTDIFSRKSNSPQVIEDINRNIKSENANLQCDLVLNSENFGNMYALNAQDQRTPFTNLKNFSQKLTATPDSKKQFLAPLTACVNSEDKERLAERYRCQPPGKESEYSLQDIEEGLRNFEPKKLGNQPDVIAETPQNETSNDELALFVQQDSGRMEKLKKRYSAADDKSDDDDDYGFNKRPLVKGVKSQYNTTAENPPPVQQAQCPPRYVCPNSKPVAATMAAAHHMSWPYYSQDGSDHKVRQQFYTIKQTDQSGNYAVYGTPQEYRTYTEVGNADYTEFKGQQKINYSVNQGQQQNIYATTNTFYRCHPVRFGGYSELSNYQFRHPPHSPPPMRRIMAASQPSPVPSDDCKIRVENRVFINRSNENYTSVTTDTSNRLKVGMPDGANVVLPPTDGMKAQETTFYRRTVPNVQNPCLQMKFSPMGYQQGVVPTASIRFSASCSPHTVTDEQNVIVDPQYATFQHPPTQNTVGVIRVEQGQQMIRVPVPYATGTPVQVHLMAGRLGRCESPQRPNSPQGAVKVPLPPYNQYFIPKGIQTGQQLLGTSTPLTVGVPLSSQPSLASQPATQSQPQPQIQSQSQPPVNPPVEIQTTDVMKTIDFEKQGKAIAEELQQRQKLALSRSLSQETNYQSKLPPTVVAPINTMVQQERGVPEGAASSSMQDCQSTQQQQQQQQQQPENGTVAPAGNTVYYTMNI
ncbi:hypothetical protein RUM44_001670 [Polyplax serrata]|uniref:Uncharacterized protein n=1 Tax=Polyplax serrata TaxID=468196 RepID=A0ABR1AKQ8_POLSC